MEQKLEQFWCLESYENAQCCIQINQKLSVCWRTTPL